MNTDFKTDQLILNIDYQINAFMPQQIDLVKIVLYNDKSLI